MTEEEPVEGWGPLGELTKRSKPEAIKAKLECLQVKLFRIGRHWACYRSEYYEALKKKGE